MKGVGAMRRGLCGVHGGVSLVVNGVKAKVVGEANGVVLKDFFRHGVVAGWVFHFCGLRCNKAWSRSIYPKYRGPEVLIRNAS